MNPIQEQMYVLCKIQDIESRRRELLHKIEDIPTKIASIEDQIAQFYDDLEAEEKLLVSLEQKYREAENTLDFLDSSISKGKSKITQVKNNKEYRSSLKEIDVLGKKREDLEDSMLKCLEDIEDIKMSISKKMKLLAVHKEKLTSEKNAILNEESEVRASRYNLGEKVKNARKSIDPEMLLIFDNLAKRVKNRPASQVLNSICLGCNMRIPYQMLIKLQKFSELNFCPHCGRIIYWGE